MEERNEHAQVRPIIQKMLSGLIFAASFASSGRTEAQTADRAEAIDMDAEVIERDTKASPLRLEIETSALDSTIYKRSDFNEFHAVDSAVRLKYLAAPLGDLGREARK